MLGISTGTETIVLLQSEPDALRLLRQLLSLAGYTIREAADGPEAVRRIQEGGRVADLLLADMEALTERDRELIQRLAQQFPKLRILLISGQAGQPALRSVAAAAAHILPKPYSPGALMSKVREVLDQPRAQPAARGAAAGDGNSTAG